MGVTGVQFFVDGTAVGSRVTTAPYTYQLNTTTLADGAHTLTAQASDAAGNTTTSLSTTPARKRKILPGR